jgi:hypothetical protein
VDPAPHGNERLAAWFREDRRTEVRLSGEVMTDTIKVVETGINQVIADIDDMIDQFILSGYDMTFPGMPASVGTAKPSRLSDAKKYYYGYYEEVVNFDEAYSSRITPKQRKNFADFLQAIVEGLTAERKISVVRKPRKARPKTPEQQVKGIKYLKKDPDLKVESIEPTKIVGSTSLWVYNVKVRKLTKYVSLPGTTLTLKGTTVQNMDVEKSVSKTLRKPEVDLPIFATDAKNMIEAKFLKIKAKPKVPNGRINRDTLLIRAFK